MLQLSAYTVWSYHTLCSSLLFFSFPFFSSLFSGPHPRSIFIPGNPYEEPKTDLSIFFSLFISMGLSRWLSGKESACQCSRLRFHPWVGKIPWSRRGQPTPVFLPGKFHGQRSLAGYNSWGSKVVDTLRPQRESLCRSLSIYIFRYTRMHVNGILLNIFFFIIGTIVVVAVF